MDQSVTPKGMPVISMRDDDLPTALCTGPQRRAGAIQPVTMTVALEGANTNGAFRAGEAWGHVLFYIVVVIVLVLVLRRLRRRGNGPR